MALFGKQMTISSDGLTLSGGGSVVFQGARPGTAVGSDGSKQGGVNLDNILKLIPGDIVSLYITGLGINIGAQSAAAVTGADSTASIPFLLHLGWPQVVFWTCLLACLALRAVATKPTNATGLFQGVNWSVVVVTGMAFFIWAHAVSDPGPVFASFHGAIAGFVAMVMGLFAPLVVKAT